MSNDTNLTPHCVGDNNPALPAAPKGYTCPLPGFEYCPRASDDFGKPTWVGYCETLPAGKAQVLIAWQRGPGLVVAVNSPRRSVGVVERLSINTTVRALLTPVPHDVLLGLYIDLIDQQLATHKRPGLLDLKAGVNVG